VPSGSLAGGTTFLRDENDDTLAIHSDQPEFYMRLFRQNGSLHGLLSFFLGADCSRADRALSLALSRSLFYSVVIANRGLYLPCCALAAAFCPETNRQKLGDALVRRNLAHRSDTA